MLYLMNFDILRRDSEPRKRKSLDDNRCPPLKLIRERVIWAVHSIGTKAIPLPYALFTMPQFQPLRDDETFQSALARSQEEPIILYKHSSTCPLSAAARREMEQFVQEEDVPVYEVVVQEARPASNRIAEELGIRHETPQVILLDRGRPLFDASHRDITTQTVRQALPTPDPS